MYLRKKVDNIVFILTNKNRLFKRMEKNLSNKFLFTRPRALLPFYIKFLTNVLWHKLH